jgi:hypothetical protein
MTMVNAARGHGFTSSLEWCWLGWGSGSELVYGL